MAIETDIQLSQRQQKKRKLWIEGGAIIAIAVIFAVILPLALPAFRLRLLGAPIRWKAPRHIQHNVRNQMWPRHRMRVRAEKCRKVPN